MPERPVLGAGRRRPVVIAHGSLLGRDEPDQHPVEAIGGLDAWLVGKLIAGSNITLQVDDDGVITISASGGGGGGGSGVEVALGETSDTAYRGDRGKTAYDHSQATGNPHGAAVADITGLTSALDGKAAASHSHSGADITTGTVATARLGSGTADGTTYLRGDQTWAAVTPGASAINDLTDVDTATDPPAVDDVLAWDGSLWTPAGLTAADTGAIPASIIDAKGDVIVGTAADTAARLAVGTDGQVLTADSAETSGVKWAAPAGGDTGYSRSFLLGGM